MIAREVYVAAPLERRDLARELAAALSVAGFRVVSTWHSTDVTRTIEQSAADWTIARELAANESEIRRADVVIALHASEGRETLVEIGIALAHRVDVIAVDPVRLASYRRPGVEWIDPAECAGVFDAVVAELAAG